MGRVKQITEKMYRDIRTEVQERIDAFSLSHHSDRCEPRDYLFTGFERSWAAFGGSLFMIMDFFGWIGEKLGFIIGLITSLGYCLLCLCFCFNEIGVKEILETCSEVGELTGTGLGLAIGGLIATVVGLGNAIFSVITTLLLAVICPCWCCNSPRSSGAVDNDDFIPQSAADVDDSIEENRRSLLCCF